MEYLVLDFVQPAELIHFQIYIFSKDNEIKILRIFNS